MGIRHSYPRDTHGLRSRVQCLFLSRGLSDPNSSWAAVSCHKPRDIRKQYPFVCSRGMAWMLLPGWNPSKLIFSPRLVDPMWNVAAESNMNRRQMLDSVQKPSSRSLTEQTCCLPVTIFRSSSTERASMSCPQTIRRNGRALKHRSVCPLFISRWTPTPVLDSSS
jgi:hypothetical protein